MVDDAHLALTYLNRVARQADEPLDIRCRRIVRKQEHNHIAAFQIRLFKPIKSFDLDALVLFKTRQHRSPLQSDVVSSQKTTTSREDHENGYRKRFCEYSCAHVRALARLVPYFHKLSNCFRLFVTERK